MKSKVKQTNRIRFYLLIKKDNLNKTNNKTTTLKKRFKSS